MSMHGLVRFAMFLVVEVPPLAASNGHVARVMMNAERLAGGQTRIFMHAVSLCEYISTLKRLTNYRDPAGFLRVMEHGQRFVSRTYLEATRRTLAKCSAFHNLSDEAKLHLSPERLGDVA